MQSSIHARLGHAESRHHALEPARPPRVREVFRWKGASRHGRSTRGANVRMLGIGVLVISLATSLIGADVSGAWAVSDHTAVTRTVTAPAAATWTLPDADLPQVVLPPPPPPPPPAPPSTGQIKQFAASLVGSGQFGCLDKLWNRESGWDPTARNASSGAFGIPQSLPGSKMAAAGGDWQTNPMTQVRWGVDYIKRAYGSPCGAWAHSQATGWY